MKELRFYIGDVAIRLYETYAGAEVPLDRIEIQESDNFDTGYTTIESYSASTKNEYLVPLNTVVTLGYRNGIEFTG
jgi:hypothetical protein